jgi:hypothetical protein
LKPNVLGIIGGILAFISTVLPWWTITISSGVMGITYSSDLSLYPYQAKATAMGISMIVDVNLWYGWAALALVIVGGVLGIVGSLLQNGKALLIGAGVLALLSIIIFAVGLQSELSKAPITTGYPQVGLFSNGSSGVPDLTVVNYTTYLSLGYWITLVAAIIMLVASRRKNVQTTPPQSPPPS